MRNFSTQNILRHLRAIRRAPKEEWLRRLRVLEARCALVGISLRQFAWKRTMIEIEYDNDRQIAEQVSLRVQVGAMGQRSSQAGGGDAAPGGGDLRPAQRGV